MFIVVHHVDHILIMRVKAGRAATTWPSTHDPVADQPYIFTADQPKGCGIKGAHVAVGERVK